MSKERGRSWACSPGVAARLILGLAVALAVGAKVLADTSPGADGGSGDVPTATATLAPTVDAPDAEGMKAVSAPPLAEITRADGRAERGPRGDQGTTVAGVVVSAEDGYIADGQELSPFDDAAPAIANLDPDLLAALQLAATDAEAEGITMVVNSGWRSETYQKALLDEAVVTYGSEAEARKWVDTPEGSNHVKGGAVDVGPEEADSWLIEHGSTYGLCQTYANEIWHFQLMTEPGGTCPAPLTDATAG